MQQFNSADARHDFAVDRARYYLPALDADDLGALAAFGDIPRAEQGVAMREFLAVRARAYRGPLGRFLTGQKDGPVAVREMSLRQAADLFREWSKGGGFEPGEASGSADES